MSTAAWCCCSTVWPWRTDGTRLIEERLTHQELAHRLGCSREMVSRLMKDLELGGYLQTQPQQWRLPRSLPARW